MTGRKGPLARVNLFRLAIFCILAVTAVLAFTLQAGIFRALFRGVLLLAVVLLLGSYLVQWWIRRVKKQG
ncbi:MAG: hypothetical protein KF742_05710 [Cryobacterium sp.]|nr:hypothetical protein [Cryobacterium sp.]MBX3090865.1 hypothetical protein [Cryobacterium sp.]